MRSHTITTVAAALCLSQALASAPAWAQGAQVTVTEPRNFPIQRFVPAMDRAGIAGVEWAGIERDPGFELALFLKYANDPLVLRRGDTRVGSVVSHLLDADAMVAFQIWHWLEIGAGTRLMLYTGREDSVTVDNVTAALPSVRAGGFGDLWISPKVRILDTERHGIELAVLPTFSIPTGRSVDYLGDTGFTFSPELAVSREIDWFRAGVNAGVKLRPTERWLDLTVEHELTYAVAAGVRIDRDGPTPVELGAALSGATSLKSPFDSKNQSPLELNGEVKIDVTKSIQVNAGAGFGITDGFGNPDVRAFAGVRWSESLADEPTAAACPEIAPPPPPPPPPPPDMDGDGVLDADDKCPTVPGVARYEGCPDTDGDKDGIVDYLDKCPTLAEDRDQFQDEDGCPDPDDDQDGVVDAQDRCPREAGKIDNFGCPDTDLDGDGLLDRFDNCPMEKGTPENKGCREKQLVSIGVGKLEISDRVYFKTNSDVIEKRSYKLLNNVAQVIVSHPKIPKVIVEGHTDNVSSAEYNKELSQRRAAAVVAYLTAQGVEPARLEAIGYGLERPIASNKTAAGKAQNRRVEFVIP